jgi:two-component system, cell cycle sensor histidine kinase and response regulator CckA
MSSSATVFDDSCRDIRNGVRVEAKEDASPLALRIGITFQDVVSQVPEASMAATETLLVVENETAIRALVKMALERHGYTVLSAESGSEALSLAADNQGPIDLLITDVVMPDLRGPDLARRLVIARPGLTTLFMSGYMDDALGEEASSLPVLVDFIQKPFLPSALVAKVRELLDRARKSRTAHT